MPRETSAAAAGAETVGREPCLCRVAQGGSKRSRACRAHDRTGEQDHWIDGRDPEPQAWEASRVAPEAR